MLDRVGRSPGASSPRLLVFGYGNPSRGDDALGPLFVSRAEALGARGDAAWRTEFLTDFQLQVEHVLDIDGFDAVLFVDASLDCGEPFQYSDVPSTRDESFSSHALSPGSLLAAFRSVQGSDPPPSSLLAIRGWEFELGQPLSPRAQENLDAALRFYAVMVGAKSPPPMSPPRMSLRQPAAA